MAFIDFRSLSGSFEMLLATTDYCLEQLQL